MNNNYEILSYILKKEENIFSIFWGFFFHESIVAITIEITLSPLIPCSVKYLS